MIRELLLSLMLVLGYSSMKAQNLPETDWGDQAETDWYDEDMDEFEITDEESLAGLAVLVADGNSFEGKTIHLQNDLNLEEHLWAPIGPDIDHSFSGTIDGNDYTISNIYVEKLDTDFAGLFGSVLNATFKNINLDKTEIYGQSTVGSLVGNLSTDSQMENCHVTNGFVQCDDDPMYGGIAGGLVGGLLTNSTIKRSSFSGEVEGGDQIGGLVGTTWDATLIEESFAEGTVSGGNIVGGLVGYTTMNFPPEENTVNVLKNSYSRADVVATGIMAGGLFAHPETNGLIENCYSIGSVTGGEDSGASIGSIQGETEVLNTYFDEETAEIAEGIGLQETDLTVEITGKTTEELKNEDMVDSLNADQDEIWTIDENINDGYPSFNEEDLSVDAPIEEDKITLYPTVASSEINFIADKNFLFTVYTMSGREIDSGKLQSEEVNYSISSLNSGVYLVVFENEDQKTTKRFIKK